NVRKLNKQLAFHAAPFTPALQRVNFQSLCAWVAPTVARLAGQNQSSMHGLQIKPRKQAMTFSKQREVDYEPYQSIYSVVYQAVTTTTASARLPTEAWFHYRP